MGQKVNPIGFRLFNNKNWESIWYDEAKFAKNVINDIKIRQFVKSTYRNCGLGAVLIERLTERIVLTIKTSKPGLLIGKKGLDVEKIGLSVSLISGCKTEVKISEIDKPDANASIISQSIAKQLEARASFKKVIKKSIQSAMKNGALGIKVTCSGRLAGAEIARVETFKEGSVPLHTLRSNIDYSIAIASTTYGIIGIKVWVYKGFSDKKKI